MYPLKLSAESPSAPAHRSISPHDRSCPPEMPAVCPLQKHWQPSCRLNPVKIRKLPVNEDYIERIVLLHGKFIPSKPLPGIPNGCSHIDIFFTKTHNSASYTIHRDVFYEIFKRVYHYRNIFCSGHRHTCPLFIWLERKQPYAAIFQGIKPGQHTGQNKHLQKGVNRNSDIITSGKTVQSLCQPPNRSTWITGW